MDDSRALWNSKAAYWDDYFKEGNSFHRTLVEPTVLNLLDLQPGESILDVGAGNGAMARRLASLGASVVAVDFSEVFIERARARSAESGDRIDYRVLDATDLGALLGLQQRPFDAVISTMALMDIPDINPLAEALPSLLKPRGRFVFAIMHPCFNSLGTGMSAESWMSVDGDAVTTAMKVQAYLHVPPGLGTGIPGDPNPHRYFHRPLHELFGTFFRHGLVLDGLLEPAFERGENSLSWADVGGQIPPVLTARMRLAG